MKTPPAALFRAIVAFGFIAAATLIWSGCATKPAPAPAPADGKTLSPSPIKIKR